MKNDLSSRHWQLLSAYLDAQLKDKDKRQVEELLQHSTEARDALDMLRRTRTILRAMPMRKAPRNFTISPESIKKPILPTFTSVLRFSSAMAALLLVAVLALDFLGLAAPTTASRVAEDAATEMLAMEAPAEKEGEQPPIIFWGGPGAMMGANGKGGGGDGAQMPMGGGTEGPAIGIGGGEEDPGMLPQVELLPEAFPQEEELPSAEEPDLTVEPAPLTESEPVLPMPEELPEPEPLTGTGPILGVRPLEERGEISAPHGEQLPTRRTGLPVSLTTIEIILAVLFVLLAIPAWLLRRK